MVEIAMRAGGESRRQERPRSWLLSLFGLPGKLKLARRYWRVGFGAAAVGVALAGWTGVEAAGCGGWNTGWLWTSASAADIQACLDIGADPNVRDSEGRTPLHWAAWSDGPPRIFPLPGDGRLERLVDEWQQVWRGRSAAVAVLLEANADPNARDAGGSTPLHWASRIGQWWADDRPGLSVYELLLKAGADPNSQDGDGRTPLHMAVSARDIEKITLLLEVGANLNVRDRYGATPFHLAVGGVGSAIVSGLLDAGADPMARDWYDRTPLHQAARGNRDREVIALLVASGADPNAVDRDGLTPLHYAAWDGPQEMIEALLEAKAAPNAQGKSASTPLHLAAIDRGVVAIATILKAGADVHLRDADGGTALHVAARKNEGDEVLTLLQAGADPRAVNDAGETPWDMARINVHRYLIEGTPAWCWLREKEPCPPPASE